jgi:ribosomal protein S18 acetylase RimI-like enzyme
MVEIQASTQEAATVRKATLADVPRMSEVLADAFYTDPPFTWVLHRDPSRRDTLKRAFELSLRRIWMSQDVTYTTGGVVAAAIWELPGQWRVGVAQQLRMLPAFSRIFGRHVPRALRAQMKLDSDHPAEPHYYLPFIGVAPDWQGRGLGAAVMAPILERCDRERMPAYLDATTHRNRALYERLGFMVTDEFILGKDAPPLWRMWRAPG